MDVRDDPNSVRFPRLRPAASDLHYRLHHAALEWSLDAPIAINSEEEIESKPMWQDRFSPYAHQIQNLITFCRRAPVALLADDVGLGKTISAGLILSELMIRRKVSRALVLCPKLLLPQWAEEMDSKFGIDAVFESGASFRPYIRSLTIPVTITTYDTARRLFDEIMEHGQYDMIILDEVHKLRNLHGTSNPPKLAVTIRDALEKRAFKYVLMLTATPIQNRLWDLYSLIDLLTVAKGHRNPLGEPDHFAARYISDSPRVARQLNKGRRVEFRKHLSNYMVRTRRDDSGLEFPERSVRILRTPASETESRLLQILSRLFREESLNALAQTSIAQALMSSPEALRQQLANMADRGTVPIEYSDAVDAEVVDGPVTGKLQRLLQVTQELSQGRPNDWRVVVFTTRKLTQAAIGKHLESKGISVGYIKGGAGGANQRAIKAFWSSPPSVNVLVSTDAGAEGVNLQVANVLVNYDLPWNPMVVEQRIGRIQRLATEFASVQILNLVIAGSVEERVVARLGEKLQVISDSLGEVESILESAGGGIDEEGGMEAIIRKLVVDSLRGKDVEAETRKALSSIEQGKRIFEDEKENVERIFGQLDELHRTGPRAPKIAKLTPSMSLKDFTLRALEADGGTVRDIENNCYEVDSPGTLRERITFDEATARAQAVSASEEAFFSVRAPKLYQLGKPAFERLSQSWSERNASLVRRLDAATQEDLDHVARLWLADFPDTQLRSARAVDTETHFQGRLTIRANVAVAHDRLESLIELPLVTGEYLDISDEAFEGSVLDEELAPNEVCKIEESDVLSKIRDDENVKEFCRFYAARLADDIKAAGKDRDAQEEAIERLTPAITADAVSMRGTALDVTRLLVSFTLDNHESYEAEIKVVASIGRILDEPKREECELSGRLVPDSCLASCAISGTRAIRHLLIASEDSERVALTEHTAMCPVSGKTILEDEFAVSDVSGAEAAASVFLESEVHPGRIGLPEETDRCEFTRALALQNELLVSDVSGRKYREDQQEKSVLSGRIGHVSEFVSAVEPIGLLARDEAGKSDLSGQIVAKRLLVQSEMPPHRTGLVKEMTRCEESGQRLLRDEVEPCAITGRVVERGLLSASAISKKRGLRNLMVECDETGATLLPTETERCEETGNRVVYTALGRSAVSGRRVLRRLLRKCAETGDLALSSEFEACEVTGKRVIPDRLDRCDVTGRRALKSAMLLSVGSQRWFTKDRTTQELLETKFPNFSPFLKCEWLSGPIHAGEAGRCSLTGIVVTKSLLNDAGEHQVFRNMLDGNTTDSDVRYLNVREASWLGKIGPAGMAPQEAWGIQSADGALEFLCVRVKAGFLRRSCFVGGVFQADSDHTPVGERLVGYRRHGQWQAE